MNARRELRDELDAKMLLGVLTALKKGDFSARMPDDWTGLAGKIADTLNSIMDASEQLTKEISEVSRVVGREGRLTRRAVMPMTGVGWSIIIKSVNALIDDLVRPTSEMARVIGAVARGDLSQTVPLDVDGRPLKGQLLRAAATANTMVEQLSFFASEVTRVAREVGTEGKLGSRANVPGVAGTWKDLTDSVNSMAGNLTLQVRNIADVTTAVATGDLSKKITVDVHGEMLQLKETVNTMVEQLRAFASEVTRVAREVGTEGKLGGHAHVPGVGGTWKDLTDNVNFMASNLTGQLRNIANVTTAVARGDLSQKITVDVRGEMLQLKDTVNTMVDQLRAFASEVTRVAREVGTEGRLGGQAQVAGAAGTWKDLTDSVNFMAANLTAQVRGIAGVVTAVAKGDLTKKLTVAARGEIAALASTINQMTDTLAVFADQATTVAREVGVEGKLGGQALVPGASGTWKDLTENVNQLAANLSTQVRAIAEVATAVTRGDLSRSIQVAARGEVAELKDNINEMIRNLKETTQKNAHQDWLKTNLARFTRLLQGQRDLQAVSALILSELAPLVSAQHGVFYRMESHNNEGFLCMLASYGYSFSRELPATFMPGEGLVGQCALEKQRILLTSVPPEYIRISSGLGAASPGNIVVLPILFEHQVKAVIELASFDRFTETHLWFLDQLMETIGVVLNTIEANSRTESLLMQSQSLAQELQQTNLELAEKARLLFQQNSEVERKNREVEQAKLALEEKATQLALSSKYKSEFLANMSHELRTPLNSLLILAQQLSNNHEGNLTETQVEFARTIYASGSDLLTLINDILDLSKIESGTVTLETNSYRFHALCVYVERTFRHMAEAKNLKFSIELSDQLPPAMMTDIMRLQQILKNLLSNAFKFTALGEVILRIGLASEGWSPDHPHLARSEAVLAFSVIDTGIGISADKLQLIFEAFQQADGSTARRYGGTGLGLSISRELARLLNGEIRVESTPGIGSTFVLYLPCHPSALTAEAASTFVKNVPAMQRRAQYLVDEARKVDSEGRFGEVVATSENSTDDRALLTPGDPSVLIIASDVQLANVLLDHARERNYRGIVSHKSSLTLPLARDFQPTAIMLDGDLVDVDGFAVLDQLKRDLATRHIPVHILSANDEHCHRARTLGVHSCLRKPICADQVHEQFERIEAFHARGKRRLLVAEGNAVQRSTIVDLIGAKDLEIVDVASAREAIAALQAHTFDCIVLGGSPLADRKHVELVELIGAEPRWRELPLVRYAANDEAIDAVEWQHITRPPVIKEVHSLARLLDETALFLHRSPHSMTESQRRVLAELQEGDDALAGRSVLIIDDDLRNIFALSSALERQQMRVVFAENGKDGIKMLQQDPTIEVVLMDIMMPEMDGYDTTRAIRAIPEFESLPIVTLTAKAMKGDRDKCLAAGASDYITKPVDIAQLLSRMRVWLPSRDISAGRSAIYRRPHV